MVSLKDMVKFMDANMVQIRVGTEIKHRLCYSAETQVSRSESWCDDLYTHRKTSNQRLTCFMVKSKKYGLICPIGQPKFLGNFADKLHQ